jgi:hypothetical protein
MQSLFSDTGNLKYFLGCTDLLFRLYITLQVMAITQMSPGHEHAVTAFFERLNDKRRFNPSGAHDPYDSYIVRILQPGNTGQIGAGVCTPIAQKSSYFRFKIFHPFPFTLFLIVDE